MTSNALRWCAAVGLMFVVAAITPIALAIQGRLDLSRANELARRRPSARVLSSTVLPDIDGTRTHWGTMTRLESGALLLGRADGGGPVVVLALDLTGRPVEQVRLQARNCNATLAMVAVGKSTAIVGCPTELGIDFFGVAFDGAHLAATTVNGTSASTRCAAGCMLLKAAHGEHHFWGVPTGANSWAIGAGVGLNVPTFAAIGELTQITDLAAYSDNEVLLTSLETDGRVRLGIASKEGRVLRSVAVAELSAEDVTKARPRIFSDGHEIVVFWIEWRAAPRFVPLVPPKSFLVFRRYDSSLASLGSKQELSQDSHVVPFTVQQLTTGGVIAWDQGTRGSWDASSFVRFHSVAELEKRAPKRVPFGVLPVSLVEVNDNLLSIGPQNGDPLYSNRAVVIEP